MNSLMDICYKFHVLFFVSFQSFFLVYSDKINMRSSKTYILTKHCKDWNDGVKFKMHINLTGAFIKSHSDYLTESKQFDLYPDNFTCEIVAEAPAGSRIMLLIESFNIPAHNTRCDENFLYVFDFESSRSKAMAAAGGENGLCGKLFPRSPIFTTGPFITIVFKSHLRNSFDSDESGFQLTLTEIQPADKATGCKPDRFQCSSSDSYTQPDGKLYHKTMSRFFRSGEDSKTSQVTVARQIIPQRSNVPIDNYCIPIDVVCDGIRNCHDGSDENVNAFKICNRTKDFGIINRFLSLGLSASIAIAVSCIIAITFCVGITVCYCMRLCTSRLQPHHVYFTKGVHSGSDYQPPTLLTSVKHDMHSAHVMNSSSQYGCIKKLCTDHSPPLSTYETDKMCRIYQESKVQLYHNIPVKTRPASEKLCHWTSSSLASYPSTSDGHHSHPETPYFQRDPHFIETSPFKYRHSNNRHHSNSCTHHTPTSSRSAKSTHSTKSSNIEKKASYKSSSKHYKSNHVENQKLFAPIDSHRIKMLGPVLGEV